MQRVVEWFTRRRTLSGLAEMNERARALYPSVERARSELALAEAALDPRNALPKPAAAATVLALDALHAVLAAEHGETKPTLAEQWHARDAAWLDRAIGDEVLLLDAAITGDRAELDEAELRAHAQTVVRLARDLLEALESRHEPLYRARFQRSYRLTLALAVFVGIVVAAGNGIALLARGPDLAKGKPWRASSALEDCPLGESGMCHGQKVDIFFCTKSEASPWVEWDFGEPITFSKVLIENRSDCCKGRAVPLIVEVSDDAKTFRQVAQREKTFDEVTLSFTPETARYLRLRVDKTTPLHLERVSVYR